MRLTTMTDYALRLAMYLGRHPDRLCTIAEVAKAYRISEAHLMKITHRLGEGGWIQTLRGRGGGMRLARAPVEINLGSMVRDIEPDFQVVECFSANSPCTLTGHCKLTGVMQGALGAFQQHLDRFTLADILAPEPDTRSTGARGKVVKFSRRPRLRVA